jgi:thiamine biosynthesis protein ThiS
MVKINGKELNIGVKTIAEYVLEAQYDINRIAVEQNGHIVPKKMYNETIINDGDVLEIVSFVGGG